MPTDELQPLRDATDGLLYPSESDAPFDAFRWPAKSADAAERAIQKNASIEGPLEEVPLDQFFAELKSTSDAARFANLRQVLTSTLKNVQVFRSGEVQVHIFLIGRATNWDWAGLQTVSVET